MSIDVDGVDMVREGHGDFEGTLLPSSPRVMAAQQTAVEAASAAQKAESVSTKSCVMLVVCVVFYGFGSRASFFWRVGLSSIACFTGACSAANHGRLLQ